MISSQVLKIDPKLFRPHPSGDFRSNRRIVAGYIGFDIKDRRAFKGIQTFDFKDVPTPF